MSAELAVAPNPSPIPSPTPLAAPLPPRKKPVTVDAALLFHTTNFILSYFKAHFGSSCTATDSPPAKYDSNTRIPPLIVGLNGIQGAGKTTLVNALANALINDHGIKGTLVVSIDDFYLTHADQQRLAAQNPDNKLVQHRGEPGTHDIPLLHDFFAALLNCGQPSARPNGQEVDTHITKPNLVRVPQYDKSLHSGRGDRTPSSTWPVVNGPDQPPIQLVLFEGWCVGFRALSPAQVEAKWSGVSRTLGQHTLASLQFVNEQLREYDAITNLFGAFVHLDAEDLTWVYDWRRQQEEALREEKGTGMTDEEVERFVDCYYPAYELYYEGVRKGVLPEKKDAQIRMVVRRDRSLERMEVI